MKPQEPVTLRLVVWALSRKLRRFALRHKWVVLGLLAALALALTLPHFLKSEKAGAEAPRPAAPRPAAPWDFDDNQPLHAEAALRYGIPSIDDREAAERLKGGLVEITDNADYHVARLTHSIPYLTPAATLLLTDIAHGFRAGVQRRGYRAPRLVVTSLLRTRHDVGRLQRHNANATENSAHMYATTFDISYRRFEDTAGPGAEAPDSALQNALRDVLRTLHDAGRCYVKKERRQPCYHITVRGAQIFGAGD